MKQKKIDFMDYKCTECVYGKREPHDDGHGAFKLSCSIFFLKTSLGVAPRVTCYKCYQHMLINHPTWCPLLPENYTKPKIYDITKDIGSVTPTTTPVRVKDPLADMPSQTPWDEIMVGERYLLPKFGTKPREVIVVKEKNEEFIKVSEIYQNGVEAAYATTISKDDVAAKFIVKQKKF